MIPKVIHYCWFGRNPLPALAKKCIRSWKKYLPDYEIKEWNEDNFDVNMIPYTQEAYKAKKYAFVSDYARFWILYHCGGLYFDTDVEVIKPINDIISKGAFMGCQTDGNASSGEYPKVAPGLGLGAYANMPFYEEMLNLYEDLHFQNPDGTLNLKTIVLYSTEVLIRHGLLPSVNIQYVNDIWIYPKEYFCPLNPLLEMDLTCNSRTIHHFSASWLPYRKQLIKKIKRLLGYKNSQKIRNLLVYCRLLSK